MKHVSLRVCVSVCALALLAGACGSDSSDDTSSSAESSATQDTANTTTESDKADAKRADDATPRPTGALPTEVTEITGGQGKPFFGQAVGADLKAAGYQETEFRVAGDATSYTITGGAGVDGRYEVSAEDDPTPYATRIVVRRPVDAAKANGSVLVEWLNVSGGIDANPDFAYAADEILRRGYTWVGVSAQSIGVEGGATAVGIPGVSEALGDKGLKGLDPDRYSTLSHPGDTYSYDIYTQVARAIRDPKLAEQLLGDLEFDRVLAVGESQSAFALTTYYDAVQPLEEQFDGFFIHSRGGSALPLRSDDKDMNIAGAITGEGVKIRTDRSEPVMMLLSESDLTSVIGYYKARQDDSTNVRVWEVAGTAHADRFLLGVVADQIDCSGTVNSGPHHYAVKAALAALDNWVATGEEPAKAEPLEVTDAATGPTIARDELGIAKGGIRLPQVAAPTAVLSGEPAGQNSVICLLLGSTKDLSAEQLRQLYPSVADYTAAYEKATDEAVAAGFLLAADKDAVLAEQAPDIVSAALGG